MNTFGRKVVHLRDALGRTPLHLAAAHNNAACMRMLLQQNALFEVRDNNGKTPLLCAAQNGHLYAIGMFQIRNICFVQLVLTFHSLIIVSLSEILLSCGADVKAWDNEGNTALHLACERQHTSTALLLLENMPNPEHTVVNMANRELKT